jgi:23S rRNA pseudouridine1911/1915/1917 synthase
MKLLDKEDFKPLYEDNHIIVVVKRANLLTQPDPDHLYPSLEEEIKEYLKDKYQKKGNVFLHAVHRLDKEVSGIVLFAKSSKALSRLNEEMRQKLIHRKYLALVEGKLEKKEGILKHYLVHQSHRSTQTQQEDEKAKIALLEYLVLKEIHHENKTFSLVSITLDTGRYHQIRSQFSSIHHPIVGDSKYGSSVQREEICLHGYYLAFIHPVTKKELEFENIPYWKNQWTLGI